MTYSTDGLSVGKSNGIHCRALFLLLRAQFEQTVGADQGFALEEQLENFQFLFDLTSVTISVAPPPHCQSQGTPTGLRTAFAEECLPHISGVISWENIYAFEMVPLHTTVQRRKGQNVEFETHFVRCNYKDCQC